MPQEERTKDNMTTTQEKIVAITAMIKQLQTDLRAAMLADVDERMRDLLSDPQPEGVKASKTVKPKAPRKPREGSIPDQIVKLLGTTSSTTPTPCYTADELIGELRLTEDKDKKALRKALARLVESGHVKEPEPGVFCHRFQSRLARRGCSHVKEPEPGVFCRKA
jgi:hypothetical protein